MELALEKKTREHPRGGIDEVGDDLWWLVAEALPSDTQPRFPLHDRDKCFAGEVAHRVRSMGVEEVLTAPGSPWQTA